MKPLISLRETSNGFFFAFLSFHTVHTPLEARESVIEKYRKKFEREGTLDKSDAENGSKKYQNIPEYAAMVQHMDENVGRLLKELDALDLRKNTIVIFTSDNGGKHTVTSNAPLRGAKHNLYEGGIRIPATIRYPGRVQPGSRSGIPLITDDLYPTLLDLWSEVPAVNHRKELSIMFSEDDGQSWTDPVVIARTEKDISYPYLFEIKPGELWLTTWRGGLRARLFEKDFL